MKEILVPLNFTTTPTLYDTKQSFSTSDAASGVLVFTTTADVSGTVASLTIRNASENANRQTVIVERLDVNRSPFSYVVKMPLPFGSYEGDLLLKKNLAVVASAKFLFGVNSSLSAEVLPKLVEAYSLDELVENVEKEVSFLKDAYSLTVSETVKGVNKTEQTLQLSENVRYLNEATRKANELLRISQENARVTAEEGRVTEFADLVDSAVIEQTVTQEVAEKYQQIEATQANRLLTAEQQLEQAEQYINAFNGELNNVLSQASWVSSNPSVVSVAQQDGVTVFTKLTTGSATLTATLSETIVSGEVYRLAINAKTTDLTVAKKPWLRSLVGTTNYGEPTNSFVLKNDYSQIIMDILAIGTGSGVLAMSSSNLAVGEVMTIAQIKVSKLTVAPDALVSFSAIKGDYLNTTIGNIKIDSYGGVSYKVTPDTIEVTKTNDTGGRFRVFLNEMEDGEYDLKFKAKSSLPTSKSKNLFIQNDTATFNTNAPILLSNVYSVFDRTINISNFSLNLPYICLSMNDMDVGEVLSIQLISLKQVVEQTVQPVTQGANGEYTRQITQATGQILEPPLFTKAINNPIFKRNDAAWLTSLGFKIYFPWVVNVGAILGVNAIDDFYMYYSSDHAIGEGGIGLATAPHPTGPWTDYGKIYSDIIEGEQTETPSVVFNPDTNLFHMYYQNSNAGRNQSTCLATSANGVDGWTRYGVVIDVPDYEYPGDGHTGYARVHRFGKTWIAYHLMGGADKPHFGISYSADGLTWQTDPRPLSSGVDITRDNTKRLEPCQNFLFNFRGNLWSLQTVSPFNSGTVNEDRRIYLSPASDLRCPNAMFEGVFEGTTGTWDEATVHWGHVIEYEGSLYLYYTSANIDGNGAIGLAVSEV